MVEKVTQNIETFLGKGQVHEATTLAISFLSSSDNDTVGWRKQPCVPAVFLS